jgi:hypothetical protein
MARLKNFSSGWRPPGRRGGEEIEREVAEELLSHVEMRTEDYIAAGMSPAEARAAALRRFGDLAGIRRVCCEIDRSPAVNKRAIGPFVWAAAGFALAFRTMSGEYHNLRGVSLLMASVIVMLYALIRARRMGRMKVFAGAQARSDPDRITLPVRDCGEGVSAHDAEGRTPLERILKGG